MQLQTKSRSVRTYEAPEAELFLLHIETSFAESGNLVNMSNINPVDADDFDID